LLIIFSAAVLASPSKAVPLRSADVPTTNNQQEPATTPPQVIDHTQITHYTLPKSGVPVLMYHSINYNVNNDAVISPKQFAAEMAYLYENNFHTITLDQLYDYLTNHSPLPENPVALTFDDGYADNYTFALPVLKKYNMKSALFMVSGFVNSNDYYLNWQQLREMKTGGFEIYPHTVSHPRLAGLDYQTQRQEVINSKEIIEKKLGGNAPYFCYPYGNYNRYTINLLKDAGYRMAFVMQVQEPVKVKPGDDLFTLRRIFIGPNTTMKQFIQLVSQ